MNMTDKRDFVREIEAMSKKEIEEKATLIRKKFKNVFDELAKH